MDNVRNVSKKILVWILYAQIHWHAYDLKDEKNMHIAELSP